MADIVAERGLIGSVLIVNQEYYAVSPMLRIEMFTSEPRRWIWRAIEKTADEGLNFDALYIANFCAIRANPRLGDTPYTLQEISDELMACLNAVPHAAHAKYYAEIVAGIRE